ncbi:family 43 glycosylhydrolase [Kribbella sandramycini]|uniref:Beta-xylosidase n=1 Tax=Kribbella sandramycini TaxID=60450 RepID=A0A7Y4L1S7_9ACTN|nr:glycoside hydrolase family 43 protein [Kribbella sandramycini]MBB6565597.1 beta-xylosidase [Kribbella sandramycini]NOL41861.1 family 43 glycosylhydrolase [Kribbella sandramycini]
MTNPVYGDNFADPFVLAVGEAFLAFATNGPLGNVQTLRSTDLVSWERVGDALPALPGWTAPGRVWAPEVIAHDNQYLLYYTSADPATGHQAVGVATADRAEGPYVDKSLSPLLSQAAEGGSIDASPFRDPAGALWLYWKNDGNAIGVDTWIYVQRLSADGLTLEGPSYRLIKQDLPWEGALVEAPYVVERHGLFHLFYSANAFDKPEYAVGHATGPSPTGPFTKSGAPILTSPAGPGHNMVLTAFTRDWFVHHAWDPTQVGTDPRGRTMHITQLTWSGDTPVVTSHPPPSAG